MQGDLFRIHLNTFRSVFPNSTFWYVYGSDQAFLLATPEPFTLDVGYLQEQLDRLPEWFRAQEYQIDTVARIAGFFWLDGEAMVRMIGDETRVNTDDLHYFDKQSALEPAPPQLRLPRFQVSALPYFMRAEDTLCDAIRTEQMVAQLLARYGFYRTQQDLFRAYCLMPGNGNVRYFLSRGFPDGKLPDHETFCTVRSLNQQALRLRGQGRYAEAVPLYRQVLAMLEKTFGPEHPGVAETLKNLAELQREMGNTELRKVETE